VKEGAPCWSFPGEGEEKGRNVQTGGEVPFGCPGEDEEDRKGLLFGFLKAYRDVNQFFLNL
jgi:hypothetical protein